MRIRDLVLSCVIIALLAGAAVAAGSIQQQASPTERFRGLIEELRANGTAFSVEFAASLPTGERSRTFSTEPIRVGDDYFCFGEPWNNETRYHCTPFDNIISVTFTQ
jgi:hypothetical protein